MSTPIRITFDSNVWRPLVSPSKFTNDPDAKHFDAIRQAIQATRAVGFLSETVFTLEAIQKNKPKGIFWRAQNESAVDNGGSRR